MHRFLERIIYHKRTYLVFAAAPGQRAVRDPLVQVFDLVRPPPPQIRRLLRTHMGALSACMMLRRLRCAGAVLLVLLDGPELAAYGWLQTWGPLRRSFWWLADQAICLGPFWTHPARRGRGIYGRLLAHSLVECAHRFPGQKVYIWTRRENKPSIRAIRKAGFAPLGEHEVQVILGGLFRRHRERTTHQPGIATADRGNRSSRAAPSAQLDR